MRFRGIGILGTLTGIDNRKRKVGTGGENERKKEMN